LPCPFFVVSRYPPAPRWKSKQFRPDVTAARQFPIPLLVPTASCRCLDHSSWTLHLRRRFPSYRRRAPLLSCYSCAYVQSFVEIWGVWLNAGPPTLRDKSQRRADCNERIVPFPALHLIWQYLTKISLLLSELSTARLAHLNFAPKWAGISTVCTAALLREKTCMLATYGQLHAVFKIWHLIERPWFHSKTFRFSWVVLTGVEDWCHLQNTCRRCRVALCVSFVCAWFYGDATFNLRMF